MRAWNIFPLTNSISASRNFGTYRNKFSFPEVEMKIAANLFLMVSSLVNTNWKTSKHSFSELSFYTRNAIRSLKVTYCWSDQKWTMIFFTNKRLSWLTFFAIMVACPIWKIFICLLNIITSALLLWNVNVIEFN